MTDRATYHVHIWRDPDDPRYWLAQAEEDEHVHTFGRTIAHAKRMAVDALALWYREDVAATDVHFEVSLPLDLEKQLRELRERREELRQLTEEVTRLARGLAQRLTQEEQLTYRDAGELLNLSHQRVAQLVTS